MNLVSVCLFRTLEECEVARGRLAAFGIASDIGGASDPFPSSQGYQLLVAKDQARTAAKILADSLDTNESSHDVPHKAPGDAIASMYDRVCVSWQTPFLILLPGILPWPIIDAYSSYSQPAWMPSAFFAFHGYQILWIVSAFYLLWRAGFSFSVFGLSRSPVQLLHAAMMIALTLAIFMVLSSVYRLFGGDISFGYSASMPVQPTVLREVISLVAVLFTRIIGIITVVHCSKVLRWRFVSAFLLYLVLYGYSFAGPFGSHYSPTNILDLFSTYCAFFAYYYFSNAGTALGLLVIVAPAIQVFVNRQ